MDTDSTMRPRRELDAEEMSKIIDGAATPDAAPPEEGEVEITKDIFDNRWATGVVGKQPPPSDAAQKEGK